ncbi:MAG: glycosyltransferase [Xenococcus sp. (in: cyanobacteria)]
MKITLISHAIPYPPIHGGRIDIWRRMKAFADCGVKLQLIYWSHDLPQPDELAEIEKYTEQLYVIPFQRSPAAIVRRIIDLFSYPYEIASRILRDKALKAFLSKVEAFNPDLIFLDGIQGGIVANDLSKHLNIPVVTRSHNIEHLYQQRLLGAAKGWRKLKKRLYLTNLEQYEEETLSNSALFYDISVEDLKFWQKRGLTNGRYLPPLIEFAENSLSEEINNSTDVNFTHDIIFLGGLGSDNNIEGVVWFLTKVVPLIRKQLTTVKILIAGLDPVNKIKILCEQTEGVELKINPPSPAAIYRSGRVLINPVSAGSGVNIKSIEMLVSRRPIVTRSQGISGLPEEIQKYFMVAEDPQSFAKEIVNCLSTTTTTTNNIESSLLNSYFGPQAIKNILSDFELILEKENNN